MLGTEPSLSFVSDLSSSPWCLGRFAHLGELARDLEVSRNLTICDVLGEEVLYYYLPRRT